MNGRCTIQWRSFKEIYPSMLIATKNIYLDTRRLEGVCLCGCILKPIREVNHSYMILPVSSSMSVVSTVWLLIPKDSYDLGVSRVLCYPGTQAFSGPNATVWTK